MPAQFYQTPWGAQFTLNNSHSTNLQTIATLTAMVKIDQILISSTTAGAKDLQLVATIGANDMPLGTFSIPANTGNLSNVATLMLLRSAQWGVELNNDIANNKILSLPSGTVLKAKVLTSAITSGQLIHMLFTGEAFT